MFFRQIRSALRETTCIISAYLAAYANCFLVWNAVKHTISGLTFLPQLCDVHFGNIRDAIVAVWVPPVALDNRHVLQTLGAAGGLVANLRSQILANGLSGVVAFCRGVREAAAGIETDGQEINLEGFRAAATFAGAELTVSVRPYQHFYTRSFFFWQDPRCYFLAFPLSLVSYWHTLSTVQANETTQAFRHLDRRGTGKVHMADALRAVRGEVNERRAHAIDDAFDSLLYGLDDGGGCVERNSETLEPSVVAKLFRVEAHPEVVSGARAQGDVLSEFLKAFEGKTF